MAGTAAAAVAVRQTPHHDLPRRSSAHHGESGKAQIYVQAYPGPGAKIQISSDGGTDPVWKRSGGELFYRSGDSMMAVAVRPLLRSLRHGRTSCGEAITRTG